MDADGADELALLRNVPSPTFKGLFHMDLYGGHRFRLNEVIAEGLDGHSGGRYQLGMVEQKL